MTIAQATIFGETVEIQTPEQRTSLASRFVCPPFSVLDTKQGYWQERKRLWISLGIESELGRLLVPGVGNHRNDYGEDSPSGGYKPKFSKAAFAKGLAEYDYIGYRGPKHGGNGSGQCNADITSVYGPAIDAGNTQSQTGTSIFDPVLCEIAYTWFCPPGGAVLDPFAGGSVRGIVAAKLGRHYTGIDLSKQQIEANREQAQRICRPPGKQTDDPPAAEICPTWVVGNSQDLKQALNLPKDWLTNGERFDFVFTCPPYYNLEQYSDDPADLSAKPSYGIFKVCYRIIISKVCQVLKQNRFACFVVGNLRDEDGNYHDLVGDTVQAFSDAGLKLYNEIILLTSIGSLPIRAGGQFNAGRKVGKAHQNVLVFVKGDGMIAAKECEQL